jgi:hypothetical protein
MSENRETEELNTAQLQDQSLTTGLVNRLDCPTDREQSTIRHGQQAWHRLGRDDAWEHWTHVGAAVVIGRSRAMHEAAVNRPVGRRYKLLFAAWLKKFGFENIDKADRCRLFAVMDHLEEIETWRATLTPTERLRLNHPSAVLRKWKSANAISSDQNAKLSPMKTGPENSWELTDRPEDIATAMLAKLGRDKAAAVAGAILTALEQNVAA